jgi:hypothetical protein
MGEVWRCRDEEQDAWVAIKAVRPERVDGSAGRLFQTEILAVARLAHPAIVPVYDLVHAEDGTALLVMALCPGVSLGSFIPERPAWPFVRSVLAQALDALAYAHARGVLHLDIKPDNLLVDTTAGDPRVTLLDFGIARITQHASIQEHFKILGTLEYMAPEQCTGSPERFGPWTDLFALGAVAFELCSGERPFVASATPAALLQRVTRRAPPLPLSPDVPPAFAKLCAKMLDPDPAERPLSSADVRAALFDEPETRVRRSFAKDPPPGAYGLFGLREVPLLGREEERRAIHEVLESARTEGRTTIAVLEGPAGVGKSRIARDAVEGAEEQGRAFGMTTSWSADGMNGGCRALLVNLFEARGGHPEDVAERVSLFTARFGGESDRFAREVSLVLFPPPAAAPDADLPLRVAVEAIARVARSRPVVLWLEDVQWSRLEAVALVCAVSMHDPPLPVAIVATARIEEMPRRTQYDALVAELSARRVPVARLDSGATRALVRGLLDVDEELCDLFAARAEGNPLFVTQLLRQLVHADALERRDGRYRLSREVDLESVPADIGAIWQRRIELSGADPRHLAALAIVREQVQLEAARAIGPALGEDVDRSIAAALAAGLLDVRRGAYAWVHQLLRAYLLARVAREDVARMHAIAADVLAPLVGQEDVQEERARHLALAGEERRACKALLDAGLWSARRADPVPRRARFDQLLVWTRDAGLVDLEVRALAELAMHHADVGEAELANERIAEAGSLLLNLDHELERLVRQAGWVALRRGHVARLQGRREEGAQANRDALALGTASQDPEVVAHALLQIGLEHLRSGRRAEAREPLLEGAAIYRARRDGAGEAQALRVLAGTESGEAALATAERAVAVARAAGATRSEIVARQVWVDQLWAAGRRAEARREAALVAEEGRRRSWRQVVAITELELARWATIEGDDTSVREHLAEAERWGARAGAAPERAIAAVLDAYLASVAGDDAAVARALEACHAALPGFDEETHRQVLARVAERAPELVARFAPGGEKKSEP